MVLETGYLQRLYQKMVWSSARSTILANNLARMDMPGEKAHDIAPFQDIIEKHKRFNEKKVGKDIFGGNIFRSFNEKQLVKNNTNLTGNSIIADNEMQKLNDTATEFTQGVNTYQKMLSLYRRVLGGRD